MTSSITLCRYRRTAPALTGLLLATSLSACGSVGKVAGSGGPGGAPVADTTTTTDTPTTDPLLTSEAYQVDLTGISSALGPDLTAVLSASSQDTLKDALSKLSADAKTEQSSLPTNPPADAVDGDQKLSDALAGLASSADSTSEDVGSKVCTAGSATAELTRSDGAVAIRAAATALASANPAYKNTVGKFLPAPIADQTRQLPNGKVLRHSSGPGSLEIDAADEDAVITLTVTGSKTPTASIYVRAGDKATLSDIPGKTFDAYVSSGTDWDSAAGKFTRDCSFGKTDSTFDFSSSDWSLQLTKQAGGNLSMTDLGAGDAPQP